MFNENLDLFFNQHEFAVTAVIRDKTISGILSTAYPTLNGELSHYLTLLCAAPAVKGILMNDVAVIENQHYQVIGIQHDGTGLATLTLTAIGSL